MPSKNTANALFAVAEAGTAVVAVVDLPLAQPVLYLRPLGSCFLIPPPVLLGRQGTLRIVFLSSVRGNKNNFRRTVDSLSHKRI